MSGRKSPVRIANGTLVMVIDGSRMLLFRNEGDSKYVVLDTLSHTETRNPPTREQGSDAPGRSFSSTTDRRSSYEETDWHRQAEERFAIEGAATLEKVAANESGDVVVIATPRLLGVLRKHWGRNVSERLIAEIDKDLAHHEWTDIVTAIEAHRP
jgi:protein required for attachment to host cells